MYSNGINRMRRNDRMYNVIVNKINGIDINNIAYLMRMQAVATICHVDLRSSFVLS